MHARVRRYIYTLLLVIGCHFERMPSGLAVGRTTCEGVTLLAEMPKVEEAALVAYENAYCA